LQCVYFARTPQLNIVNPLVLFHVDVGTICGADYAGEVVKIGSRQDPNFSLKVGDRVAGIVHGGEPTVLESLAQFGTHAIILPEEQVSIRTKVLFPSMFEPTRPLPGRSQTLSVMRRR